jgi:hypothetical protein
MVVNLAAGVVSITCEHCHVLPNICLVHSATWPRIIGWLSQDARISSEKKNIKASLLWPR